jgi:WhiB family redox-sensing transcriptional regulator
VSLVANDDDIEMWVRPVWMDNASCRGLYNVMHVDPDLSPFDRARARDYAKGICFGCPVRLECVEHGVREGEKDGIYGGLDEAQRRAISKLHPDVERRVAHARSKSDEQANKRRRH